MEKVKDLTARKEYLIVIVCWFVDVTIFFGRYTYSANIALMTNAYSVSNAEAGLVMTFFSMAYGLSQFFHGLFCTKYPKRIVIPGILLISAAMNALLFIKVPFSYIKYIWLVGGLVQSALWPLLMQVISENVSKERIWRTTLLISTITPLGTLSVYGVCALCAKGNFRFSFLVGACVLMFSALLWFLFYKKKNLSPIPFTNPVQEEPAASTGAGRKLSFIFLIVMITLFCFIGNFVKDGLQTWVPAILKELFHMGDGLSIVLTLILPFFAAFGGALCVFASKKLKGEMQFLLTFFLCVTLFLIIATVLQNRLPVLLFSFGALQLLLSAVYTFTVTVVPLKLRDRINAGSLTSIINGGGYLGSSASTYVLGKVADLAGWAAIFITLTAAVVFAMVCCGVYLLFVLRKSGKTQTDK